MLTFLAHQDGAHGVDELWSRWHTDPAIVIGLVATAWAYNRGTYRRRHVMDRWRARAFWCGWAAVALALLSPLDAVAAELASAHMVQHILLVLVGAPLLAFSAPVVTLLAGAPDMMRRGAGRARRRLRLAREAVEALRTPEIAWLLHAATLWFWHASGPYDAALDHTAVHALEHAMFLGTGVLFWSALRPARASTSTLGHSALLVFAMAMQSVFLAALLTFARTPWYGYAETEGAWGLDPLADQQLAGVIMWVPAGLIYVAAGVLLVARWVRASGHAGDGDRTDDDWGADIVGDGPALSPRR